jgi:hypothetical protein
MAKGTQTFQKRQRETKLREKAQRKRERRQQRKSERKEAQVAQAAPISVLAHPAGAES